MCVYILSFRRKITHRILDQTCAHFGALMFGSDIDGRQMRGKGSLSCSITHSLAQVKFPIERQPGILKAAAQYGVQSRIMDLSTFDITRNPWRCGGFLDAIITDPPCRFRVPFCSYAMALKPI